MGWATSFVQPAALVNLVIVQDTELAWVRLSWDASAIDAGLFQSYRIYRQVRSEAPKLVGEGLVQAAPSFADSGPEVGEQLTYYVTVYDGYQESVALVGETILAFRGWWLGMPQDEGLTVRLKWVAPGFDRAEPAQVVFRPRMGSTVPIALTGETLKPQGRFQVRIDNGADLSQVQTIRAIATASRSGYCFLRTGLGESLKVMLGTVDEVFDVAGKATVSVPYTTVRV